ncbi:hypothetical protein NPIL_704161 [Nephila pilipes]|uniref:Uncharacterized protein n=1 Tax=Nephila pilipes TaxID=299642 RepID=A0A8X6N9S7_NEPPI|nr:hypothetical protein NPIL_704161 [Nephila pilipes]
MSQNFQFTCYICVKRCESVSSIKGHLMAVDLTGAESECPIEENCGDPMESSTNYGDGYFCLEEGCTFFIKKIVSIAVSFAKTAQFSLHD